MKRIFPFLAFCISYSAYAQFPVELNAAHPKTEFAKLEPHACTILFTDPIGYYLFFPFAKPRSEPGSIAIIPSPQIDISFYAEKGKKYNMELQLNFAYSNTKKITISGPASFAPLTIDLGNRTLYYTSYKATATGWVKFMIRTTSLNDTWLFKSCTIKAE